MSDIKCRLCLSPATTKTESFKPYVDVDWAFDLYECSKCHARFANRTNGINYFEILYQKSTNYERFTFLTDITQKLLSKNSTGICRRILCSYYSYGSVIKAIEALPDKSLNILEVGCSTGFLTAYLNKVGHNCFGVDISEKAIAEAIKKFGNNYALTPPEKKYEVIFMCGLGGGIDNIAEMINTYLEMLVPGGILIFNAPNLKSKTGSYSWLSTPPPDVITLYQPDYKQHWFPECNSSIDIQEHWEIAKSRKPYKYPLTLEQQNAESISIKYKSSLHFVLFIEMKALYMKFLLLVGRARKLPAEYGLLIKIRKVD